MISFDNRELSPKPCYVAWIDLLGAGNHMLLSLPKASTFIAKIHIAGIKAKQAYPSITIHPITDGFFAVSETWADIKSFSERVMRTLANCFEREREDENRFLARGAIAFGRLIEGAQMERGASIFSTDAAYPNNIMVGSPLSWAYKAESKAPPFGIYIDQSITTHSGQPVAWVLHRWWNPDADPQKTWGVNFGKKVLKHFEWLRENSIGTRYPVEKHDAFIQQVKEYYRV